jgi:hypothetical protein
MLGVRFFFLAGMQVEFCWRRWRAHTQLVRGPSLLDHRANPLWKLE